VPVSRPELDSVNAELYDALVELLVRRLEDQLAGSQLVDWAMAAVQQGVETDSLILLAGLSRDCSLYEATPLLDRGLAELGLAVPAPESLRRSYVAAVSRGILAGRDSIDQALEHIHRWAVTPLNHPPDLQPWCFLWEGLHPTSFDSLAPDQIAAEVRRLASVWAADATRGRIDQ
jgi:hypothetical protein